MTFTAPQPGNSYTTQGTDVGIVNIFTNGTIGPVTWLTSTLGVWEYGSHLTTFGTGYYFVSWYNADSSDANRHYLAAIIDTSFNFQIGPEDITNLVGESWMEIEWKPCLP